MTIFLEIAKKVILDKAKAIREASEGADASRTTKARGFFGVPRDTELSAKKRSHISGLEEMITALTPSEKDDTTQLADLKKLISDCIDKLTAESTAKGHARGSSEPELETLKTVLEVIFTKLKTLKLLDVAQDKDPLNVFRYFAALFFAQKIVDSHTPSIYGVLASYPLVSSKIPFEAAQDELVSKAISNFAAHTAVLDSSHAAYIEVKQAMILAYMCALQRDNDELTHKYPMARGMISPDNGFLKTCLEEARTVIIGVPAAAGLTAAGKPLMLAGVPPLMVASTPSGSPRGGDTAAAAAAGAGLTPAAEAASGLRLR